MSNKNIYNKIYYFYNGIWICKFCPKVRILKGFKIENWKLKTKWNKTENKRKRERDLTGPAHPNSARLWKSPARPIWSALGRAAWHWQLGPTGQSFAACRDVCPWDLCVDPTCQLFFPSATEPRRIAAARSGAWRRPPSPPRPGLWELNRNPRDPFSPHLPSRVSLFS
jgi:hypothetical protein